MKKVYILLLLVLIVAVAPMLSPQVLAATALDSPYENLSVSIDSSTGTCEGNASAGVVSVRVEGLRTEIDGIVTLTNDGSNTAVLSFSYVASGVYSSFTIGGSSVASTGTYSTELIAGGSLQICLIASAWELVTLDLTNIKLEEKNASNLTVSHNGLGSIKVNNVETVSGTAIDVGETGVTLSATPSSEATFLAWINTSNSSVVSSSASFTYVPTGEVSLKAVFAHADYEACFWGAAKTYLFEDLSAAITYASKASNKTIVLAANGTLSSGNYSVPSGVTLLIPFDSAGTCYTTSPGYVKDDWKSPSPYYTMTMANGAEIVVGNKGAISVSAKVSAKMGYAGAPTSVYGHIAMETGSKITVNSGGNLYAWGYITGAGEVLIESGATVYESFQVVDWRGGTASSGMIGNQNKVFPMTQYYIQNVEALMTWESGATEKCSMIADIISVRQVVVPFLGKTGCMFNLTNGTASKRYDGSTDRIELSVDGAFSVSKAEIVLLEALFFKYKIDTSKYVLPINNGYTLNVNSGTLSFDISVALLPGAQLNIAEGTTVELTNNSELIVYDETEWKKEYYVYSNAYFRPVRYAVSRTKDRTNDDIIDASICVNGTLDASDGCLYTTVSGANIYSTGNGSIVLAKKTDTVTYQAVQTGTSISYTAISITTAKLKHENGDYLTTATNTYTFDHYICSCDEEYGTTENGNPYAHGKWATSHKSTAGGVNAGTCTEKGYTTYTCSCSAECRDDFTAIDPTNHLWGAWTNDHTTHTSACGREGCEACVTFLLEYRLDSYTWLNATVTVPDGLEATLAEETAAGYTFKWISDKYYLVRQIHAKEIPTAFTATLTVGGKELLPLNIGFAAYKTILDANTKTSQATKDLLKAMVAYGNAAYIYFTPAEKDAYDNSNVTPPALNMTGAPTSSKKDNATKGDETIATNSAKVYFDEAVRMSVFFTPSDALYNNANIVQIGLLLGSSGDLYTSNCEDAYVIYSNLTGVTIKPGSNYPVDIDELKPGVGSYLEKPGLDAKGRWEVCFDLGVETYAKVFELRPYVVVKDGDTTYCVYGEQVHYSLATYVSRTYKNTDSKAYKNLLSAMWDYVVAADAAY